MEEKEVEEKEEKFGECKELCTVSCSYLFLFHLNEQVAYKGGGRAQKKNGDRN